MHNFTKNADDPMEWFFKQITSSFAKMTENLTPNKDSFDFLQPKSARTSRFYILPYIHKTGITGRPIILSCNTPQIIYRCRETTIWVQQQKESSLTLKSPMTFFWNYKRYKIYQLKVFGHIRCYLPLHKYSTWGGTGCLQGDVKYKGHPQSSYKWYC